MSSILYGELQDCDCNPVYAHTEASIVFLEDGSSLANFLQKKTDAELEVMTDAILKN
ncbi:MAG: hypothetical protein NC231_12265 [Bacillus sp. (in: Bacteria)]|nr:hypothetical protein [Bacillus sp. (in: firmicutes)]MCM1427138.1 hypothetical protein [Eubacterium sp.]